MNFSTLLQDSSIHMGTDGAYVNDDV